MISLVALARMPSFGSVLAALKARLVRFDQEGADAAVADFPAASW